MPTDSSTSSLRYLSKATDGLNNSMNKLASGKRITKAKDDPAGAAIAASLDAAVVTLSQASRNTSDGSSAIQIADSAISSIGDIRTRQAELAVQAANGTNSQEQRAAIQGEVDALSQEADRIVATTEFNGQKLLQGSSTTLQVGTDSSANSQISTPSISIASTSDLTTATQATALAALDGLNQSISGLSKLRGELGATESRLDVARSSIASSKENLAAASSRIQDLDVASEVGEKERNSILQKSSANTLQQANVAKGSLLKLLS